MKGIRKWTEEEIKALIENYSSIGAIGCSKLINRTPKAIRNKASFLGLKHPHGKPPRKIIRAISDKKAIALCPKHGETLHYIMPKKRIICITCQKERDNKRRRVRTEKTKKYEREYMRNRRKEPRYMIENRLRASLSKYLQGKASFSKNLPYSREELFTHLREIWDEQGGKCPMCGSRYEEVGFNIDHIIPLSHAKNGEELLKLYALENLTTLCPHCNQHVKRDRLLERNSGLILKSQEVISRNSPPA